VDMKYTTTDLELDSMFVYLPLCVVPRGTNLCEFFVHRVYVCIRMYLNYVCIKGMFFNKQAKKESVTHWRFLQKRQRCAFA